jgi:hypothetical protein
MKSITTFILFLMAALLCSCKDAEEFKIPADLGFRMDINRGTSSNGRLNFTKGSITLASFSFDGRREQGGDIYFSRSYESGLSIAFDPNQSIEAFNFTILQGNYTRIEIEFETSDESDDSSLVVEGWYLHTNGTRYPLRFELESSVDFEIEAKEQSGNKQIVIKQETPAIAEIKLDPVKWFEAVPVAYLDNAEIDEEDGSPVIIINEDTNEDIYAIVVSKIESSAETVFK